MKGNGAVDLKQLKIAEIKAIALEALSNKPNAYVAIEDNIVWYDANVASTKKGVLEDICRYCPQFNIPEKLIPFSHMWDIELSDLLLVRRLMQDCRIVP